MIVPIKHILNETGVSEKFLLIVPEGNYSGTYEIKKMDGWNQVDSVVDINDEFFNVESFIIGETTKLKFSQFNDPKTYTLVRNVYKEQGGDGRIVFKWIAEKAGIEYDLLGENFELNLNKYSEGFGKTKMSIELEIIKSEAQNKLFTREDTTVDLFAAKDLDNNDIEPIDTFNFGFKKGNSSLSNFYTYEINQRNNANSYRNDHFFAFVRSDDFQFGNNTNSNAGERNNAASPIITDLGPFVSTDIALPRIDIQISNLNFTAQRANGDFPDVGLYAIVKNGGTIVRTELLKVSVPLSASGITYGKIIIESEIFHLSEGLKQGESLTFQVITRQNNQFILFNINDSVSIMITTNNESPIIKTTGVRLITAIDQIIKSYTASSVTIESNILGLNGYFYNTSISTGMYLRGLPPIYLLQKIKTSLKSLLHDGVFKLLGLGFDVNNNKYIVEEISYFFKDISCYDLSEKSYLSEGFKTDFDKDLAYNTLLFGSSKYSTNVKFDIKNFNTEMEVTTPIISNKNKLDKKTNLIIDPYKIQELVEDKTTSTNDNDDDLVLIDIIGVENYSDTGIFEDCVHAEEGGFLVLTCTITPFDTTLIEILSKIDILQGINQGNYNVLDITGAKMKLDKTTGIEQGTNDTPIRYKVVDLFKNRTVEGFTSYDDTILNPDSTTNIRHNPKYQMARWFPFFGSGLMKKGNSELLKVTNYKNNSTAKMTINSVDMANELQGNVVVGGDENLGRMREFKNNFFNGEIIEITYNRVTFEEFILIYNNWKFGENGDRSKSRGYLSCNTPYGVYDIYPFGTAAFSHSKEKNTLSLKGKIKGLSVANPILLSVNQIDKNNVTLHWDYSESFINPAIRIQVSLDGFNWSTIKEVNNIKTDTVQSDIFNELMTGDSVYFRVLVSSSELSNKSSNSIIIDWQFNDWTLKEINRTENVNCGYSYLTLELKGNVNLDVKWNFMSSPGGGSAKVIDLADNSEIISFTSPYGDGYDEEKTNTIPLNHETKMISIQLTNSNQTHDYKILFCSTAGIGYGVNSTLNIEFKNLINGEIKNISLSDITLKRYLNNGPIVDPGV